MNPNVPEISSDKTTKEAAKLMVDRDCSQIVVTEDNEPKWILDISKITQDSLVKDKPIKQLPLSPVNTVQSGAEINTVLHSNQSFPLIVTEDKEKKKVKGIVTAEDVSKAL
jgi:CBS domain-containing protein